MNWVQAEKLDVNGVTGWRLPRVGELGSITKNELIADGKFWSQTEGDTFGKSRLVWNTHTSRMEIAPVGWKGGRVVCVRTMAKPADPIEAEALVDTARSRCCARTHRRRRIGEQRPLYADEGANAAGKNPPGAAGVIELPPAQRWAMLDSVERELEIDAPLRALLAELWRRCAGSGSQVIAPVDLVAVEQALGSVVPDAIVALAIARGISLAPIVEYTSAMASFASATHGLPAPFVAIETWGDWPALSVGFSRTPDRGAPALQVWDWKTWTRSSDHPIRTVTDFVQQRLAGSDADAPVVLGALDSGAAFRPRIGTPPRAATRFVSHAKFGRGEVLEEIDGKLRIAFADGERTLLARFVSDA